MTDSEQTDSRGVALTQYLAAEAGLIFREQPTSDFGIDAQLEIKEGSTATGRLIAVQIKSGQSYLSSETQNGFWHSLSDRHRNYWVDHSLPVIVVLCDLIARICYYELVTSETCVRTASRWKMLVPKKKTLVKANLSDLASIASPIAAASEFTICSEKDMSHAGAKRISLDIIAHLGKKSLNKPMLGAIVRQALQAGKDSKYARDEIAAKALSGRAVDVVFGFVYLRETDRQSASWICRFQWISNTLEEAFKPTAISGEQDDSGLVIEWQDNSERLKFFDERRATKADFLTKVDSLLINLPSIEMEVGKVIASDGPNGIVSDLTSMSDAFEANWDNNFVAPLECQRLNQSIQDLLATVGNAGLIWGQRNVRPWINTKTLLSRYKTDLARLNSEISFLRRDVR